MEVARSGLWAPDKNKKQITVKPVFRGHPRDRGKCPFGIEVSPEWRVGWVFLIINQQRQHKLKSSLTNLCAFIC